MMLPSVLQRRAIDHQPVLAEEVRRLLAVRPGETVVDCTFGAGRDAILLDLGVSSMQLDHPERGFSYATDVPLDMRMDRSAELTAADIVNDASERELADIFKRFGEERYARQIARRIVSRRPLTTSF